MSRKDDLSADNRISFIFTGKHIDPWRFRKRRGEEQLQSTLNSVFIPSHAQMKRTMFPVGWWAIFFVLCGKSIRNMFGIWVGEIWIIRWMGWCRFYCYTFRDKKQCSFVLFFCSRKKVNEDVDNCWFEKDDIITFCWVTTKLGSRSNYQLHNNALRL